MSPEEFRRLLLEEQFGSPTPQHRPSKAAVTAGEERVELLEQSDDDEGVA